MIRRTRSHYFLLVGFVLAQVSLLLAVWLWPEPGPRYPALGEASPLLQLQNERFPTAPRALQTAGFRIVAVEMGGGPPELSDAALFDLRFKNVNTLLVTLPGDNVDAEQLRRLNRWLRRLADHHLYGILRVPLRVSAASQAVAVAAAQLLARSLPAAPNLLLIVPVLPEGEPVHFAVDICRAMHQAQPSLWFGAEMQATRDGQGPNLRSDWSWLQRPPDDAPPLLVRCDLGEAKGERALVRLRGILSGLTNHAPFHPLILSLPGLDERGLAPLSSDVVEMIRRDALGLVLPQDHLPSGAEGSFVHAAGRLLAKTGQLRQGPRTEWSMERIDAWTAHRSATAETVAVPILVPWQSAGLELSLESGEDDLEVSLDDVVQNRLAMARGTRTHDLTITQVEPGLRMLRVRRTKPGPVTLLAARIKMPGPKDDHRFVMHIGETKAPIRLSIVAMSQADAPLVGVTVTARRGSFSESGVTGQDGTLELMLVPRPPMPAEGPIYLELQDGKGRLLVTRG